MQIIGAFTGVVAPTWGQPHAHDEVVHVQPADVPTAEQFTTLETEVGTLTTALATKAAEADLQTLTTEVATKAATTDLQALTTEVATKAATTDLQTLTTEVATKAATTDLQALTTTVSTKAATTDLQALTTTVNTKAAQTDLASIQTYFDLTNDIVRNSGTNTLNVNNLRVHAPLSPAPGDQYDRGLFFSHGSCSEQMMLTDDGRLTMTPVGVPVRVGK